MMINKPKDALYPPLHELLAEIGLTPAAFRERLAIMGHDVPARTLRRYLSPIGSPSSRNAPDWLLAKAREMAGHGGGSEWIVGTDEIGRRIVIHAISPRFAAIMQGRETVSSIEWWDAPDKAGMDWPDAARRASVRQYHREYRAADEAKS